MKLKISKETLEKTTKCLRDFQCLDSDKKDICIDMCTIDTFINDVLFLKDRLHDIYCHYKMSFGYSYICNCPTRKEIYEVYKI